MFFDRIDTVGIEREVIADRLDGGIGRLVSPDRIDGALAARRDREVRGIALVWAIRRMVRAFELRHVDILSRDVEDGRVMRFTQRQRVARVGDDTPRDRDHDARRIALDRDRMIGAGNLHGSRRVRDIAGGHDVLLGSNGFVRDGSVAACCARREAGKSM